MVKNILFIVVILVLALAYLKKDDIPEDPFASFNDQPSQEIVFPDLRCEGKKDCSDMTSCEEAEFFLRECPGGSRLDPDGDGIPCENICTGN